MKYSRKTHRTRYRRTIVIVNRSSPPSDTIPSGKSRKHLLETNCSRAYGYFALNLRVSRCYGLRTRSISGWLSEGRAPCTVGLFGTRASIISGETSPGEKKEVGRRKYYARRKHEYLIIYFNIIIRVRRTSAQREFDLGPSSSGCRRTRVFCCFFIFLPTRSVRARRRVRLPPVYLRNVTPGPGGGRCLLLLFLTLDAAERNARRRIFITVSRIQGAFYPPRAHHPLPSFSSSKTKSSRLFIRKFKKQKKNSRFSTRPA